MIRAHTIAAALVAGLCAAAGADGAWADEFAPDGQLQWSVRSVTAITRDRVPGALATTEAQVPTWQFLSLSGRNLGGTGLFADLSGWAVEQLASKGLAPSRPGDLSFGVVGWQGARAKVQVGRQLILAGAPRYVFLDGASAAYDLPGAVQISAYGGTAAFGAYSNAFSAPVYGARAAWTPSRAGHIALAFQDLPADGLRRTVGADFSARVLDSGHVVGAAAWDLIGQSLQEARLDGWWRPRQWLGTWLRAEARDPLAWLPRDSIFIAFAQQTDFVVAGGVDVRTPGALGATASYERFVRETDSQGAGYRGQVGATLALPGEAKCGATLARMGNGHNGYDQVRAWWRGTPIAKVTVAIDVDHYRFFAPVRGATDSSMATVAARYTGVRGLQVGADVQAWTGPTFKQQVLGLATVQITDEAFRPPPPPPPPKAADDDDEDEDEGDDKPAAKDGKADDKADDAKDDDDPKDKPADPPKGDKPADPPKGDDDDSGRWPRGQRAATLAQRGR